MPMPTEIDVTCDDCHDEVPDSQACPDCGNCLVCCRCSAGEG